MAQVQVLRYDWTPLTGWISEEAVVVPFTGTETRLSAIISSIADYLTLVIIAALEGEFNLM